jgi:hypothetical protein
VSVRPFAQTAFAYLHHLVTVPVRVDGSEACFVLDMGIGLTLVTDAFARRIGCEPGAATFSGRRMSGQEVTVPLADGPEIAVGGFARREPAVGVLDMRGFPPALAGIDGFLSLAFFESAPFTVDYGRSLLVLETPASLDERARSGAVVPLRLERDGPSLCAFVDLALPGAGVIEVEVDMGSDSLILDERLAPEVGVRLDGPGVRRVEGCDETGNAYTRSFARLEGPIRLAKAPHAAQRDPDVMFQRIVYDGLVGDAFLRNFVLTYDLAASRLLVA